MRALYWMITVTGRCTEEEFLAIYRQNGVGVSFSTSGIGTADSKTLECLGLKQTGRMVIGALVTQEAWENILRELALQLEIDMPGNGCVFLVPVSSVGGKKQLYFLLGEQAFEMGEESSLKGTEYELLVVVTNRGYTSAVMEAARRQGARGGTIIHAKGQGLERFEVFFGMSLVNEKEIVLIVTTSSTKNQIMQAIMDKTGPDTKAGSLVFSLPVSQTAGMRLEEEPKTKTW